MNQSKNMSMEREPNYSNNRQSQRVDCPVYSDFDISGNGYNFYPTKNFNYQTNPIPSSLRNSMMPIHMGFDNAQSNSFPIRNSMMMRKSSQSQMIYDE